MAKGGALGVRRGIIAMIGGTAGAQAISFLALPILSRMYSPDQFGYYSLVIAYVGIITSFATLRLEAAAMLPPRSQQVCALTWSALVACTTLSLLSGIALTVLGWWNAFGLAAHPLLPLWVVLFSILTSVFILLSQLALRKQQYGLVAQRVLAQSVVTAVGQIGLGWTPLQPVGLLSGGLLGRSAGIVLLARNAREYLRWTSRRLMKAVLWRYWRFPAVFAPSALLNALGRQALLIILTAIFGLSAGGQLGMAERIVAIPITLLGAAVSQAIDAEEGRRLRERRGGLQRSFTRFSLLLGAMGLAVLVGGVLLGGVVVPWLLGPQWTVTGQLVQILSVTSSVRLVATPLTRYILLLQRSLANMTLDFLRILLLAVAVVIVVQTGADFLTATWLVYGSLAITYAATWAYCAVLTRGR